MKLSFRPILLTLLLPLLLFGCAGSIPEKFHDGGLYSTPIQGLDADELKNAGDPEGSAELDRKFPYAIIKVLQVKPKGMIFKLYSNRYKERPETVDPTTLFYSDGFNTIGVGMVIKADGTASHATGVCAVNYWPVKELQPFFKEMKLLSDVPIDDSEKADIANLQNQLDQLNGIKPATPSQQQPSETPANTKSNDSGHIHQKSPWE